MPAGVDNGQLWFDHVRVPRDALLDAFASVAADGSYTSAIASVSQRFGTMVGGLTTGAHAPAAGSMLGSTEVVRGSVVRTTCLHLIRHIKAAHASNASVSQGDVHAAPCAFSVNT